MHQSSMAENCNKIQTVGEVNDVTSSEDEDEDDEDDEDEDLDEIKSDDENLASPFNEQNIVLVFDERKLFLQREHLIAVSPVFETMFSSKFPEGSMKEIPLPDKKHSHFVHFLRYLSPGFEDVLTGKYEYTTLLTMKTGSDKIKSFCYFNLKFMFATWGEIWKT